jgi:starch-binding outer membrane protein, SusD/RagB family
MNNIKKFLILITGMLVFSIAPSCTDLEEELYNEIRSENFYKTQDEVIAALAPVYGDFGGL